MKKALFFLAFVFVAPWAFGQAATTKTEANSDAAVFSWDSQSFDFGKIKQGVPVTHEFKFKNTGKTPLIITNVQASCGCTTPDWTRQPVAPGATGFIKATFNAAAMGGFNKTVTVTANSEPSVFYLTIKGEVAQQIQ
ncbi:MAG: DUF1573 domain-containing protein [Cyclobacteriaceae bacterium]|nr:DUF1573 domain-containing protein [Cyclobacteriaceae bacterium]